MSKHIATYNQFDIVKVPFPFTDKNTVKRRPALILTPAPQFNSKVGASILAMITSTKTSSILDWPMDIQIEDISSAGLPVPSLIRMKLFTLDHRLIIGCLGKLSLGDQEKVVKQLCLLFNITTYT